MGVECYQEPVGARASQDRGIIYSAVVWGVTENSPVLDLRHISRNVSVWKSP